MAVLAVFITVVLVYLVEDTFFVIEKYRTIRSIGFANCGSGKTLSPSDYYQD